MCTTKKLRGNTKTTYWERKENNFPKNQSFQRFLYREIHYIASIDYIVFSSYFKSKKRRYVHTQTLDVSDNVFTFSLLFQVDL